MCVAVDPHAGVTLPSLTLSAHRPLSGPLYAGPMRTYREILESPPSPPAPPRAWPMMRSYFEVAARTWALVTTFALTLAGLLIVFPALPVGGELLDTRISYTHSEAMAAMSEYGERGRRVYAWASPTLDTLFPLVYVTFFAGLIYRCRPTDRLWRLAFLPVVAGLIDLGENALITAMLILYPDVSSGHVAAAALFTYAKATIGPVYQLLALALLAWAVLRWILARRQRPPESP